MTVQEMIESLQKLPDKSMPVFFDCPHCGKALITREVNRVVLVGTKKENDK